MGQSVRSLAVEAGIAVDECARRLHDAGFKAVVGKRRLDGQALVSARSALGLTASASAPPAPTTPRVLGDEAMIVRLLRPLREKGKVGREHTTPIENVYGHGVPDHLKAEAKRKVEGLIAEGCLAEKASQSRRHVWLTAEGQARLLRAETAASAVP